MSLVSQLIKHLELPASLWAAGEPQAPDSKVEAWKYSARALKDLDKLNFASSMGSASQQAKPLARPLAQATTADMVSATSVSNAFELIAAYASSAGIPASLQGQHRLDWSAHGICQSYDQALVPAGQKALLVIEQLTPSNTVAINNRKLELAVGAGAELCLVRINKMAAHQHDILHSHITLAAGAKLTVLDLALGGGFARHALTIQFSEQKAHANVLQLMQLNARQHHDFQLSLQHLAANCSSQTTQRMMADGRSRAVFNGQIYVAKGADGTDAQLKTSSLMLSEHAEINSKPELEIYADDVKCSHGATIGRLDEQALFYLQARGLPAAKARALLSAAFATSMIESLTTDELFTEALQAELLSHVRAGFSLDG